MEEIEEMELGEEIVHIIPLGHEIDRAVKPFERYKANRAYILSVTDGFGKYSREMVKEQEYYVNTVTRILEKYGIKVILRNVDMFNILELIKNISNIIVEEKSKGNQVYVNISSAGRLASVAAYLAAMAHNAKAYYVVADHYSTSKMEKKKHGISICEKLRINFLETFRMHLPKENEMKVLIKLCEKPEGMKTSDLVVYLASQGVEAFKEQAGKKWEEISRKNKINCLMKLNKGILDKLEANGYIKREKVGRYNTIKITKAGIYVAYISGKLK
ncbi:transcriptional regulator [Candidatus Bathyarchaeota archaeon]|nr:transcriptional regulator [Candidatus Bathyarchaeota archaeon]